MNEPLEMEEVPCPCCEGDPSQFSEVKYFKTAKEIGTVHCKWCMDAGVVRQLKEKRDGAD